MNKYPKKSKNKKISVKLAVWKSPMIKMYKLSLYLSIQFVIFLIILFSLLSFSVTNR